MERKLDLHVCTVGELYSFRAVGTPIEQRLALFSAQRYGEGPDGVLITYGIQGQDYFRGLKEHWARIGEGIRCVMGWVWLRHVPIYRRSLRGIAEVETLMEGYPYGADGPRMAWVIVWKGAAPPRLHT